MFYNIVDCFFKPKGRFFRFVFQYLIEIQTHTAHQIYKKMRLCGMNVRYHVGKCP